MALSYKYQLLLQKDIPYSAHLKFRHLGLSELVTFISFLTPRFLLYCKIIDWTSDVTKVGGDQWNIPLGCHIKEVIFYDGIFWPEGLSGKNYRKFNQPPNRSTINSAIFYIEPEDTSYDNPNTCFCLLTESYTGTLNSVRIIIFYTRMEDYE